MKSWEIIADRLSAAGWSLGWVSATDCFGRTIWIADAHGDDGKRFVVRADEKLTAFIELQSVIRAATSRTQLLTKSGLATQFAPHGTHAEQSETQQRSCRVAISDSDGVHADVVEEP
jgi:hypothetical protein